MAWQILQGDCLEVLKGMAAGSVDMIFTDPPYGHNNNNGDLISRWEAALGRGEYLPGKNRPIANDGKEAEQLFADFVLEAKRVLKGEGCCCCCCGGGGPDPMFARWSLELDKHLHFCQMIIWDKGPMGMGWRYRRSYETVLVAYKGSKMKWYADSKDIENIIRPGDGIRKIIPSQHQHPTEKPIELAAHFIKLHTREGDTVLDPFCGSGSTGEAALQMDRNFIGIELNSEYVEMSNRRLANAMPLFAGK